MFGVFSRAAARPAAAAAVAAAAANAAQGTAQARAPPQVTEKHPVNSSIIRSLYAYVQTIRQLRNGTFITEATTPGLHGSALLFS